MLHCEGSICGSGNREGRVGGQSPQLGTCPLGNPHRLGGWYSLCTNAYYNKMSARQMHVYLHLAGFVILDLVHKLVLV